MLLRRRMSRLTRTTEKFVAGAPDTVASPVWMFTTPRLNAPTRPVSRPPTSIGTSWPGAIRSGGCGTRRACRRHRRQTASARAPRRQTAPGSREELPLLGKKQAEPGEVDLLGIRLDLGKIGVDGEVGRQILRQAVLNVEAEVPAEVIGNLRCRSPIATDLRDRVRLDLEVAASLRAPRGRPASLRTTSSVGHSLPSQSG